MKLTRLNGRSRRACLLVGVAVGLAYAVGPAGCSITDQLLPGKDQARETPGPVVAINSPTIETNVRLGQEVVVAYDAPVEEGGSLTLSLYYDVDGQADTNDEMLIATNLPTGNAFYPLNTSVFPATGRYFILLVAVDDRGNRSVTYATGRINAIAPRTLQFTKPSSDKRTAVGATVTIQFTSNETVNYVLFYESVGSDGHPSGDQTTITSGSGQNVTQAWSLTNIAPGTYFVGARIRDTLGQTETIYALGKIIVDASPMLQVTDPDADVQVYQGENVPIRFEVNDPDTDAEVSVFFDRDRIPGNGNETSAGPPFSEPSGVTQQNLDTSGLTPESYYFGVSVTDGLNDEVTVYAPGRVQVFDTNIRLKFLEPAADEQVRIAPGDALTVGWQVTAPANSGKLDVRYFRLPDGDEVSILSNAPLAPASTMFDTTLFSLQEGATYQLVLEAKPEPVVDDSFTLDSVRVFGPTVLVRSSAGISLLQPPESRTLGTGDTLFIEWEAISLVGPLNQITAKIYLDSDTLEQNGNEIPLTPVIITGAASTFRFSTTLDPSTTSVPMGSYYLYLSVNDGGVVIADYARANVGAAQGTGGSFITITINPRVTGTFWMGDAGKDLDGDGRRDSIIYIGFDFYDSAGSLVAPVGDFDNDGFDDFLVVAQFAKPFRGASVGDAYLIYGNPGRFAGPNGPLPSVGDPNSHSNVSTDQNIGILNLNSVGTTIRGALFVGPAQVGAPDDASSGIQAASFLPDLTGDGVGELAFGIPYLHNSQSLTASTPDGRTPTQLVRPGQLRRGAIIIATSQNELNQSVPQPLEIVLHLDRIGQYYSGRLEDPTAEEVNRLAGDPAQDPEYHRVRLTGPRQGWSHPAWENPASNDMAGPRPVPDLGVGALGSFADDESNTWLWHPTNQAPFGRMLLVDGNGDGEYRPEDFDVDRCRFTGFLTGDQNANYGTRILGDGDHYNFGAAIDFWRGGLVASSPALDPGDHIAGFASRPNAGIVYFKPLQDRVTGAVFPPWAGNPKPNNYVMSVSGPFGHPTLGAAGGIVGADPNARLSAVASLGDAATNRPGDFNGDGLDDLAMGAPGMNGGAGAAYIFYITMPEPYVFDLDDINEPIGSGDRRAGVQINGNAGDELGSVTPDGLDFNGDGLADAVFGIPNAKGGQGQVVLVYGGPQIASSSAGWSLDDVAYGPGEPAPGDPSKALGFVLEGVSAGDSAGSAAASVGDFDGDGLDDLIVAAPDATPRFDSNGDGVLDTDGIDRDKDGNADDVDGDGNPDPLVGAGVVYLIYGQRNVGTGTTKPLTGYVSLSDVVTSKLVGAVFVGAKPGDALGGGMTNNGTTDGVNAIGFASAGDVDGDGFGDILISSVKASPLGHTAAGEVYLIFGTRGPGQ